MKRRIRSPGCGLAALALLALLPTAAAAQQPLRLEEVLETVDRGSRVRVLAPPESPRDGAFAGVRDGLLVLRLDPGGAGPRAGLERAAALESIEALWTRHRRTWTGTIVGAAAGAAAGVLMGLFVAGLSEGDANAGTAGLVGGLLGAGAGAGLGALVGSAFSNWKLRYESAADGRGWIDAPEPVVAREPAPPDAESAAGSRGWEKRTGWLVGQAGGSAWSRSDPYAGQELSGGVALLLGGSVLADFGWLRVGPEAQLGGLGAVQGIVTYGGVFQVPFGRGRVEPYVVAGAGGQSWDSSGSDPDQLDASLFALNGGLGLRVPAGRNTALGVELRAHRSVQHYGGDVPWLFTLAATFGLGL